MLYPENQATRNEQIYNLTKSKGYGLVDAYHAFLNSGVSDNLIHLDGVLRCKTMLID